MESGITEAKSATVRFEQHIEDWYNSATDKARSWYRTHMRKISFAVAAIVVLLFNADTLRIASSIWNSDDKAAIISAMADNYAESTTISAPPASGDPTNSGANEPAADEADQSTVDQLEGQLETFNAVIEEGDLPIGWHIESAEAFFFKGQMTFENLRWRVVMSALVGWLVTTFALSLGAPFWADTLKRVVLIRETVKQTEKD
ncbi:MAG: hypothetical protein ACI8UO_001907 [Verrucomicrobiales bacterium]